MILDGSLGHPIALHEFGHGQALVKSRGNGERSHPRIPTVFVGEFDT